MLFDIAVVGSGPTAYSAAITGQVLNCILFEGEYSEKMIPKGQLIGTCNIHNYPGYPNGISGEELIERMQSQLKCKRIFEKVTQISADGSIPFRIQTSTSIHYSKSIIIATGSSYKRIYVKGTHDDEYWQKGVTSCAYCEGYRYTNKKVVVIGGGNSAMSQALHLANIAKQVYLIHRSSNFKAHRKLLSHMSSHPKIKLLTDLVLFQVFGTKKMKGALFCGAVDNRVTVCLEAEGLVFAIGSTPNVGFLQLNGCSILELDSCGYIKTNDNYSTSIKGIFACGNVQDRIYQQVITGVASAVEAAKSAIEFCKNISQL